MLLLYALENLQWVHIRGQVDPQTFTNVLKQITLQSVLKPPVAALAE